MKSVILIQGPTLAVDKQKIAWQGFDIIWSTWKGSEQLYDTSDNVIFNDMCDPGVGNIGLQKASTISGILKAKKQKYKYVLKWRSDLIPTNANSLMKLFKYDCLNFLAWHSDGNYFIDYFMFGSINKIFNVWNFDNCNGPYAERILTDHILKQNYKKYNFIVSDLNNDCDIVWTKYSTNLSTYKQHNCYIQPLLYDNK